MSFLASVPRLPTVKLNPNFKGDGAGSFLSHAQYIVVGSVLDPSGTPQYMLAELTHREIKYLRKLVPAEALMEVDYRDIHAGML